MFHRTLTLSAVTVLAAACAARAQFAIDWFTVDGGGGTSTGGTFLLTGTIGQPDAGNGSGGAFQCLGGFWGVGLATPACYPNCDASSGSPLLTANDFQCFLNRFAAADPYANCDASTGVPSLTANDFQCFLNRFAAGCS